jgi:hypothetical protein
MLRWLLNGLVLALAGCSVAPGVITVEARMGTYTIKFDNETRVRSALLVLVHNTRPPRTGDTYRLSVTGPGYSLPREYSLTQSSAGVARGWFGNDSDADFKDGRFVVTAALDNTQLGASLTPEINRTNRLEPPEILVDLVRSNDSQVIANWAGRSGQGVAGAALYYVRLNKFTDSDSIELVRDFPTKSVSVNFNGLSLEEGPRYFISVNALNADVTPSESWSPLPNQFNLSYANSIAFTVKKGQVLAAGAAPAVVE